MKHPDVTVYVDNREGLMKKILNKKCVVKEKQLHVADYQLSERMGVERKTTKDFISSIMDGRLFRQLYDLKQEFQFPILILEGEDVFDTGIDIHPNAIRGAIASIITELSISILWTSNKLETAEILFTLAKREQIKSKISVAIRGKKKFLSAKQQQEFLIAGLPRISTEKAKSLLNHFTTPEKLFTADEHELQEVPGIGKLLAKNIRKLLKKKYGR